MGTDAIRYSPSAPVSSQVCSEIFTWEEALREFRCHLQAPRAKKALRYYEVQVGCLARWAAQQGVPFTAFGKRHMGRYLVGYAEAGCAPLPLRHDAVCAKAFFRWCQREQGCKWDVVSFSANVSQDKS